MRSTSHPPLETDLGSALRGALLIPHGYALYLPANEKWSLSTKCALVDPDDVISDDQEEPTFAVERGLTYALGFGTIKDICRNLAEQVSSVTETQLLEAFLFYYDNDAFIEITA